MCLSSYSHNYRCHGHCFLSTGRARPQCAAHGCGEGPPVAGYRRNSLEVKVLQGTIRRLQGPGYSQKGSVLRARRACFANCRKDLDFCKTLHSSDSLKCLGDLGFGFPGVRGSRPVSVKLSESASPGIRRSHSSSGLLIRSQ